MASSGSSSSNAGSGVFTPHSQRYPRASARASTFIQEIHEMGKKGPRSLVATVIDTSFHTTQGYVWCTTELGYVRVYAVPMGTVCANMRIFVRQQGAQASNRSFVFDGYAPTPSSFSASGSMLFAAMPTATGSHFYGTTTASLACVSTLTTAPGYYWHCFFYLSSLPAAISSIFAMWTGTISNGVGLELLSSGLLRFRSFSDTKGYISNTVIAPHSVHWITIQPGLTGQEFVIDGISNYSNLPNGGPPSFAGGTNLYTLAVMSDSSGNSPCPIGSWVSKFGFGMSYTSGTPTALSFVNTPPQQDTDIPNLNAGSTLQTSALYLCNDTVGGTSVANTATGSTGSAITLTTGLSAVNALGPY